MDDNPIHERCKCTQSFAPYHGQRRHSDVTIICKDGVRIPAHKVILCLASPFFEKALDPEKGFKEAQQNEIQLGDHDPSNISALIDFIYLHKYPSPSPPRADTDHTVHDQLLFHASLHATADYFMVPCLRSAAHTAFTATLSTLPTPTSLPSIIEFVYTATPSSQRGLRDAVLDAAARSYGLLISANNSADNDTDTATSFKDMMDTVGEFGRDLATLFWERNSLLKGSFGGRQFLCAYCVERYGIPDAGCEGLQCKFCRRGGKVVAIRD